MPTNEDELRLIGINKDVFNLMELIENNSHQELLSIIKKTPALIKEKYCKDDLDGDEYLLVKAINCGSIECAKILIENGANVDLVINDIFHDKNSLLHLSLKFGEFEITRLLLENGAIVWSGDYTVDFIRYQHDEIFTPRGFLTKAGYNKLISNFSLGINPEINPNLL